MRRNLKGFIFWRCELCRDIGLHFAFMCIVCNVSASFKSIQRSLASIPFLLDFLHKTVSQVCFEMAALHARNLHSHMTRILKKLPFRSFLWHLIIRASDASHFTDTRSPSSASFRRDNLTFILKAACTPIRASESRQVFVVRSFHTYRNSLGFLKIKFILHV